MLVHHEMITTVGISGGIDALNYIWPV